MTSASVQVAAPILIIGGGNAGISIAARLRRYGFTNITIVEPRSEHVYAPLQSHIAGGVADRRRVVRPQGEVTPSGVVWVQGRVTSVQPQHRTVELSSGRRIGYEQLIVAAGIEQRWDAVPGLADALESSSLISNYSLPLAERASTALRELRSGTVVFTQADEPASCAGVAQKPLYLACDRWQREGVLDSIRVVFVTPEREPFGIGPVATELSRKLDEYGVEVLTSARLAEVRSTPREVDVEHGGRRTTIAYDLLHAAPPQAAANWIRDSDLHGADGFVDVDPETLRHRRWPGIWALGDAVSATPIRSGGAIRPQARVIADGLRGRRSRYDGYSETPFTVTARTAVFAEFDRTGRLTPTIPFWRTLYRERRSTYFMDHRVLPWVYWNLILTGRA